MKLDYYKLQIKFYANKFGIDPYILSAIIETESNYNRFAVRFEIGYKWLHQVAECADMIGCTEDTMFMLQRTSWGLMQLMGANYYAQGGSKYASVLLDVDENLKAGCIFLSKITRRHKDPKEIYAVYNGGSLRYDSLGVLSNQTNVDRFLKILESLQKTACF